MTTLNELYPDSLNDTSAQRHEVISAAVRVTELFSKHFKIDPSTGEIVSKNVDFIGMSSDDASGYLEDFDIIRNNSLFNIGDIVPKAFVEAYLPSTITMLEARVAQE